MTLVQAKISAETCRVYTRRLKRLHKNAVALLRGLAWGLRLLDLSDHELKGLGHIGVVGRASLGPPALQLLSKLAAILRANLALLRSQIALVADNDDRDRFSALDVQNFWSVVIRK